MGNYESVMKTTAFSRGVEMWGANWPFVIIQEWKQRAAELVEFPINNSWSFLSTVHRYICMTFV